MTGSDVDLSGKIALITGASRGIGRAVAKAYVRAGAHVILVARTTGALEELDDEIQEMGGSATLLPLDLRAFDKIDAMGPALAEKFGHIDIFVGNAGMIGTQTPIAHADAKEWQKIMDVNVNANFRLIRALDPLLRASDAGRVMFVSSHRADGARAYGSMYASSKAALEALVKTYAAETVKTPVRVNIIRPPATDTAMLKEAYPGGYPGDMASVDDVVPAFLELASPACDKHGEIVDLYQLKQAA
jgi:NAD(P)-dependent dehydrogenase (short-subunit alcohol dehydrogenase family)